MPSLPLSGARRAAALAALPAAHAGRLAMGAGRRLGGESAEAVAESVRAAGAEHLFNTLARMKAGAQKVGQALAVLEPGLPEGSLTPLMSVLARLQEHSIPLPFKDVEAVLVAERMREHLSWIDPTPVASASIGQVHRGLTSEGREVAVKIQYPGIQRALESDLRMLGRSASLIERFLPGVVLGPIVEQLASRIGAETDYLAEAASQELFGECYGTLTLPGDHPLEGLAVPEVLHASSKVLITEWVEGVSLRNVLAAPEGLTQLERDSLASRIAHFLFSSPERVGLFHADPHPGNFLLTPTGTLVVLDFGALDSLPAGMPAVLGELLAAGLGGSGELVLEVMERHSMLNPGAHPDPEAALDLLAPICAPVAASPFRFSSAWLRPAVASMRAHIGPGKLLGSLRLPADVALVQRALVAFVGLAVGLEAELDLRAIALDHLPGFEPAPEPASIPQQQKGR